MKRQQVERREKRDGDRVPHRSTRRLHDSGSMPDGRLRTKRGVVGAARTV
jgi:hypothetical protein